MTYVFGEFTLDPVRRVLLRGGESVAITGRPFDALVHLVERAGEVVSRTELSQALWPAQVVEDNNLSQTVLAARRALGDSQEAPRYIATVPRRGYQFVAPVTRAAASTATSGHAAVPVLPQRKAWAGLSVAVVLVLALIAAIVWRHGASRDATGTAEACTSTASFEASALCQQALELYRSHGGIGVSMPAEARTEIVTRLDAALAKQPRFAEALGWRAQVNLDALMFDLYPADQWPSSRERLLTGVRTDIAQALEIEAGQGMALVTLARLAMVQGQLSEARATLERASAAHPRDAVIVHYAALAANLAGEPEEALRAARLALELDPRNPAPATHVVLALLALGRHEEALAASREMIRRAPNAPIGYINLARVAASRGDRAATQEAVRLVESRLGKATPNLRVEAAMLHALAGEGDEAARLIQALRQDTAALHVPPSLGALAALAAGDSQGARELLVQAQSQSVGGMMDPMHRLLFQRNIWGDPRLETADWLSVREALGEVLTRQ